MQIYLHISRSMAEEDFCSYLFIYLFILGSGSFPVPVTAVKFLSSLSVVLVPLRGMLSKDDVFVKNPEKSLRF